MKALWAMAVLLGCGCSTSATPNQDANRRCIVLSTTGGPSGCVVAAADGGELAALFVAGALAPRYVGDAMVCSYTADPMQPFIKSGLLDVALRSQYDAEFLVGNLLAVDQASSQLQTETSAVTIQGAIVRITNDVGSALTSFTRLTSATIFPWSGGLPGYMPIGVTTVDANTLAGVPAIRSAAAAPPGQSTRVRLLTHVRFFGRALAGQSVESDEYEFPVDVCNGCLIQFRNSPLYPTPNCAGTASLGTSTNQAQIPCSVGEDLPVDCNMCQDVAACRGYPGADGSAPSDGG